MKTREVVLKIPNQMYAEMSRVKKEQSFRNITDLISLAVQRYLADVQHEAWWNDFRILQKEVRSSGNFKLNQTKEDVTANLRKQRKQIFDSDYANMY